MPSIVMVYLGGSHLDKCIWRTEFNRVATESIANSRVSLCGIDPFEREIDEEDNKAIIKHDLALLAKDEMEYVVLKSLDHMGNLSTGTACEMMLAYAMGKPVVVLTDQTPVGVQPWRHPFTEYFSSHITDSLQGAVTWITQHFLGKRLARPGT